jgi:DGQHR domain-containing protein
MAKRSKHHALKVNQANGSYFIISSIPADIIFTSSRVTRAEEDSEKGYQRLLSESRAKHIANYLENGNTIPGAIILSAMKESGLSFDENTQEVSFKVGPDSFMVIDGQHRLYGAHYCEKSIELPVAILTNLDIEDEVRYFLDINGQQRGVPRALRLEVEKFLVEEDSPEQFRIKLAHKLNESPTSPLVGLISTTKSVTGKLSHVPFKTAIEPLLKLPAITPLTFNQKYRLFENFLNALYKNLELRGLEKKLTNSAFFQAVFSAFPEILHLTKEQHGDYKIGSFAKTLEPLSEIDFEQHKGTNKKSINELSEHIRSVLKTEKATDELF